MNIKPKCQMCNRLYLGGQDGCCDACLSGKKQRKNRRRLYCLCGRAAVAVLLGEVITPEGELMLVEIPLCQACRKLEIELEAEIGRRPGRGPKNSLQIIVVKSLPRARRSLRGAKV